MKVYKVMMSLRMSLTVPLLFLIFISGVGAQYEWSVTYRPKSICALKGSTVIMGCTYSYPAGHTVKTAFWSKELVSADAEPPDLLNDPEYRDRVQYIRNNQHDCSLSLRDVRESDQSKYYFRFITDKEVGKYTGTDGVYLSVTGLQVEGPERVMEGDKVTLTCKTTCGLTDRPSFTWYRNGASLSSRTEQFLLRSVSREDAGRYSCAVLDQNLHSPEVTLNVLYLQVEGPEEVMEGDGVTLTCKPSFTLPSTTTFTWYRNKSPLSYRTEQLYLQSVSREDAGRYRCAVLDQYLHSPEVSLNVRYAPKVVWVSFSETALGCSVTLTCSSDGNPPVQDYTWFKEGGGSSSVGSGNSNIVVESGSYYCVAQNKYGSQTSAAVLVTVKGVQSSVVFAAVGVSAACLLVVGVIFFVRRISGGNSFDGADPRQNTDPNAQDDTYTALNPKSRSSNDVYDTLNANADSNAQNDTYTALNSKSRSSNEEYETLATVHSSPSDDA